MHYVNLKYELTQQQIRQQSRMTQVPELARLGAARAALPPTLALADERELEHAVQCTRHVFDQHVVLQFAVTNGAPALRMHNVSVRVEPLGDTDLYVLESEVPLRVLPYRSTGSCYTVFRTYPTVGTVATSFACELRFLAITVATDGPPGSLRRETGAGYPEEIPLHNLELSTADFHPGV